MEHRSGSPPGALVLGLLALAACAPALPRPSDPGAADVFRAELATNPKGKRAKEVREGLEQAEFEAARSRHTVLAYRTFLSEFPTGPRARDAQALLESLRWAEADAAGSEQALQGFVADEPSGPHAAEAWARLAQVSLEAALQRGDAAALGAWLRQSAGAPGHERAQAALESLGFAAAAAAALPERGGLLQAWLRDYPSSPKRAEALALLDRAALEEAVLLEDELQLRALRRGPLGDQGRAEAAKVALARAAALLDAQQLAELGASQDAGATHARALAKTLAALPAAARAKLVRAAQELFLPAPVAALTSDAADDAPSRDVPARALLLIDTGLAAAGPLLGRLLSETGAPHPLIALAAVDAVAELFDGLPETELKLRVARLRAALEPLAQDGPRLAQLALLSRAAGEVQPALEKARAAVARDPRSLVALLIAAALETGLGDRTVAPDAVSALAAGARALTDQHDPARAPGPSAGAPVGDHQPALWSLCAAERLATEANGLATLLERPAEAREGGRFAQRVKSAAASALDNARRAVGEAEQAAQKPGACRRMLDYLRTERARRAGVRRAAAAALKAAGALGAAALERAAARDPDRSVRGAAAAQAK